MNEQSSDNRAGLRKTVYAILIAVGIGAVIGRILAVDAVEETRLQEYRARLIPRQLAEKRARLAEQGAPEAAISRELQRTEASLRRDVGIQRPFLSANDRSRWCTLRALVEPEMRVAAEVGTDKNGKPRYEWVWYAIDKVLAQPGWETIDMVKHSLPSHGPGGREYLYSSKPPLLPTLMALPYWVIYMATGATLGSHPYEIGRALLILYNAVPLLVYFLLLARLIERFGKSDWGRIFTMAAAVFGTFLTTFAVVLNNHLPGAISALVALYACVRIWFDQERRLRYFVVAGLFGAFVVACELPGLAFACAIGAALFWKAPKQTLAGFAPAALVVAAGFFATNWAAHQTFEPAYMNPAWYDYQYKRHPDDRQARPSYWRHRVGIDRGEPSELTYAVHALVGHHGIFSLSPIWILSLAGLGLWLIRPADPRLRHLAVLIAAVSAVCLVFYLFMQPQENRNYGGMTAGLRWAFWFAPMWLVAMLPAADQCAERTWVRRIALVLLAVSTLSATYPTWNPWTHPWLYNFMHYMGWIGA
jgi:hypothetical protein